MLENAINNSGLMNLILRIITIKEEKYTILNIFLVKQTILQRKSQHYLQLLHIGKLVFLSDNMVKGNVGWKLIK